MKYEYLAHTADVKFKAYGSTVKEQFENAALAMFNVITDTNKVKANIEKKFTVFAKRKRTLLYEFLEEFLVFIDSEGWLLSEVNVTVNDEETGLTCIAKGDINDYEIITQVKSITYSDMELADKYVQVVLDI